MSFKTVAKRIKQYASGLLDTITSNAIPFIGEKATDITKFLIDSGINQKKVESGLDKFLKGISTFGGAGMTGPVTLKEMRENKANAQFGTTDKTITFPNEKIKATQMGKMGFSPTFIDSTPNNATPQIGTPDRSFNNPGEENSIFRTTNKRMPMSLFLPDDTKPKRQQQPKRQPQEKRKKISTKRKNIVAI